MKFLGLPILILCIYLGQICSSTERSNEDIDRNVKQIRDIYGVSEQFMDDVKIIYDKLRKNSLIFSSMRYGLGNIVDVPKDVVKTKNATIDERMMRDCYTTESYLKFAAPSIKENMEYYKTTQSILSKQLPPERYQGVMNLIYVYFNPDATTEEIESALGYLYGTDATATKTSFLDKFPDMKSSDCLGSRHTNSLPEAEYFIKTMNGIKPKVLQDFMAIYDKLPCTYHSLYSLQTFFKLLKRYQGDDSKVDACKIKANPGNWGEYWSAEDNTKKYMEGEIYEIESTLSTRLTYETYGGMINFLRATIPGTPIDEIEKALEYLYDDVPKATCPEKEGARQEAD